jgi:hypothetical protein
MHELAGLSDFDLFPDDLAEFFRDQDKEILAIRVYVWIMCTSFIGRLLFTAVSQLQYSMSRLPLPDIRPNQNF